MQYPTSPTFQRVTFALCLMAMGVAPRVATAKYGGTTFRSICYSADVIAVARVTTVEVMGAETKRIGKKVAVARVIRPLKNAKTGQHLAFLAQPTWACDISRATPGETVLLFLRNTGVAYTPAPTGDTSESQTRPGEHRPQMALHSIMAEGGGRIPILYHEKQSYIVMRASFKGKNSRGPIGTEYVCKWPEELPMQDHPDAKQTRLGLVPLSRVEDAITRLVQAQKTSKAKPETAEPTPSSPPMPAVHTA